MTTASLPLQRSTKEESSPNRPPVAVQDHALLRAIFEVPLLAKLLGVNTLLALTALFATLESMPRSMRAELVITMMLGIAASVIVSVVLVYLALRPIHALELTVARVSGGDLEARVPDSLFADRDMRRARNMINLLLDSLTSERARARLLAAQVIRSSEEEQARIAGELHDSAAQQLAALSYELGAIARECAEPAQAARLSHTREVAGDVMEQLCALSNSVHSRVLDDLGLEAAIRQLARESFERSGIPVKIALLLSSEPLPKGVATLLYRVAQEALHNAVQHTEATLIEVTITTTSRTVTMHVHDNGSESAASASSESAGLFSMRERIALADGTFEVRSAPSRGTLLTVSIPLAA